MSATFWKSTARAAGVLAAVGAAGIGYAALEARAFTVRRFTLPVLPPGAPTLRVLHVSDLHLVPRQQAKADWMRGLGALRPDLVVSTGDHLAATDAVPAVLGAYSRLLNAPGVFVLGSNDYFAPVPKNPARYLKERTTPRITSGPDLPTADLVQGFTDAGWLDLTNRRGTLSVRGMKLEFAGVDDPHLNYDRYDKVAGPPMPDADAVIGVSHAPYRRVLDAMTLDGMDLILAGHTHGGQLCLPFVGTLVTNCDLDRKRAKGVSIWPVGGGPAGADGPDGELPPPGVPQTWMHVSAGLGTSPYAPVRFACRPEASLLTLVPRPTSS